MKDPLRSSLRFAFPVAMAISICGVEVHSQNAAAQPGLSNSQGSNAQTQQPGSSQAGAQSGGTGNTSSGPGGTSGTGGVTIARPAEGVRDAAGAGGSGSSATSPAAGSPATGITTAATPAGTNSSTASGDRQLAQCLIIANEGEVAVSQLGVQQSQNPQVKQFAEQMAKDHTDMLGKLRPLTAQASGRNATYPDTNVLPQSTTIPSSTAAQTGRTDASTANAGGISGGGAQPASTAAMSGGIDLVSLKRELGAQCVASKQAELQGKQGAEFDKCFMGIQIAMHMDAVDTLTVYQKHATGELRKTIEAALPTVKAHLEHAKATMKSLEAGAATTTPKTP